MDGQGGGQLITMTPTRLLVLLTLLAAALVLPADALAAKTFRGKTQQSRGVTVIVGDDGLVDRVRVNWRTRRCQLGGSRFQDATQFNGPFEPSTVDAIGDSGAYTVRDRGGIRSRVGIVLTGKRLFDPANPAGETWEGTLRANVVVRRRGKIIDRCRLRSIGWRATLAQ